MVCILTQSATKYVREGMMAWHGAVSSKYTLVHRREWGWRKVLARYSHGLCHSSPAIATLGEDILMPVWVSSKCSVCVKKAKSRWKIHHKGTGTKTSSHSAAASSVAHSHESTVASSHSSHSALTFRIYVAKTRKRQREQRSGRDFLQVRVCSLPPLL